MGSIKRYGDAIAIQERAEDSLYYAYVNYKREVERVKDVLEDLEKRKADITQDTLRRFVESFNKIKNIDYTEPIVVSNSETIILEKPNVEQLWGRITSVFEFYQGESSWEKAGEFVMGAFLFSKRSKTVLNNAKTSELLSERRQEELKTEIEKITIIRKNARLMNKILRKIDKLVSVPLKNMENLTSQKTEWSAYTIEEKKLVASVLKTIQMLKAIIEQPIVTKEGIFDENALNILEDKAIVQIVSG